MSYELWIWGIGNAFTWGISKGREVHGGVR